MSAPYSREELISRLLAIDVIPLSMAVVSMSGDLGLLDRIAPHVRGHASWAHAVPDALREEIASRAADLVLADISAAAPEMADDAAIRSMMSVAVGETVPAEYVPMLLGHMRLFGGFEQPVSIGRSAAGLCVVIIGAGVSGICAAVQLALAGVDYVILEKNAAVGGTWLENHYPGCAVDTPNHFYQYSFAANNDWGHYFSRQPEILAYLIRCAEAFDVLGKVRFGCDVTAAHFEEASSRWRVAYSGPDRIAQSMEADILISAVGQLNQPAIPAIPGLDQFEGPVVHTARWDPALDLAGKRVALVGTGASAIQIGPAIAPDAEQLSILQRSGSWIARSPNLDKSVSEEMQWALHEVPFFAAWYRFQLFWGFADGLFQALRVDPDWDDGARSVSALNQKLGALMLKHMHRELDGRDDLIEKCTPDYPPYGKRVLQDTGWFRMLRRPNVELVVDRIARCTGSALVLESGRELEVDAIVLATGFQATRMLAQIDIRGRGGRSLREQWGEDDPRAFLGIAVPNFPNFFILFGPNTNLGHGGSAIFLAECQVCYFMHCLKLMIDRDLATIEVRESAHDAYNRAMEEEMASLVWTHPSVDSWYRNSSGRVVTNQPWRLIDYWRMTREPDPEDFILRPRLVEAAAAHPERFDA